MIFDSLWEMLITGLKLILPVSPFRDLIAEIEALPYLSWLNWFFPVGACITVVEVWLVAVASFYAYSIFMRWVKVIGD